MPRQIAVHQNRSAGPMHAEESRSRSARPYGCEGGPGRKALRLWDAFLLEKTGQQCELLLGETTVLGRILTHDVPTSLLTLNANCVLLLLRSCLRSVAKE